jgi:hypothetical protein
LINAGHSVLKLCYKNLILSGFEIKSINRIFKKR